MKRRLPLYLIALAFAGPASAQTLLWSDEFNSGAQPNEQYWSYDLGTGADRPAGDGWGNQELQTYTRDPDNVAIESGVLKIRARERTGGGKAFSSARIKTEDKLTIQYGTIEARIKVPNLANGLWPAFWTLGNNIDEVGWPVCGELDIMEMGNSTAITQGVVNRRVGSTAHWDNAGSYANYGLFLDAPQPLNGEFHIFRMEWTPDFVTTFLDGQQVWQIDIRPQNCTSCTEFHQPHFLLLNMAVGGTYTGRLNVSGITANLPATMEIDWVRVYDNGHTILGGSGLENQGPPDIGPAHSGSWYNAGQSGHGFSMEFGETGAGDPLAIVYWYIFDSAGNPIFLVGSGTPVGNVVDIDFVSPVGMAYGVFDPDSVTRHPGGTARLEFSDRDNGTFSYTPSAFSVNEWGHSPITDLPLTKLFGIPTTDDSFTR